MIALATNRTARARSSAGGMLAALVDAFPHLLWSNVCIVGMFDAIEVVARHAVAPSGVREAPPALLAQSKSFIMEIPGSRAGLLAILSGACTACVATWRGGWDWGWGWVGSRPAAILCCLSVLCHPPSLSWVQN